MTVAVVLTWRNATLDQYDRAIALMGFKPGGPGAPGTLFHWVAPIEGGFRGYYVWEARELFDRFLAERVRPIAGDLGITEPPVIEYFDVHNYLTAG